MLGVSYIPLFLFSTHALFFFFVFFLHFTFSKYPSSKFVNFNDKVVVTKNTSEVAFNPGVHFALFQYVYYYYFFFLSSFRTFSSTFFLKHISVENFTFSVYFCIFIFFLLLSVFFKNIFSGYRDITRSVDFFSVLWLFFFFAPFSVFANSLLTFFFFLEFGSILVILFIISSEEFFYLNSDTQAPAAAFFNSVFFQFWVSFFSSILLVFSILNFFFFFGTTEWVLMNFYFSSLPLVQTFLVKVQLMLTAYLFLFAVLIKMGVSPFFFFKIEIYKGLPLLVLFFYSVIYFFFFFILVFLIFLYYLNSILFFFQATIFFFLIIAVVVFIVSLFNIFLIKNFFALSSLINSILFFFLLFSLAI